MKKTKLFLGLASVAVLAACGNNSASKEETQAADIKKSPFEYKVENEGTPISGGTLRYAIINASPIAGIFSTVYYQNATDSEVIGFFDEALFDNDDDKNLTDKGIAKLSYDLDKKTVTVTIRKDVKWSDGKPLTIDDYIYSYEVAGHPDYKGIRYTSMMRSVEGMEDYKAGKASTISGIKKVDDHTVTFQMKEITSSVKKAGGFWSYALPKHVYKDIPVKDQPASDAVRKNPVGLGAFRVKSVVAGESVTLEANEYYWKGKPKLAGVVVDVVNPTNSPEEFKAGKYDIMSVSTTSTIFDSFKDINNGTLLGDWASTISYLGVNYGKWDETNRTFTARENNKLTDVRVRQALAYALDLDAFAKDFYGNLRVRANTLIPPTFTSFHDSSVEGYKYNPEKAKQLLDEAGFKDKDGDGLREDANGNKLTLQLGTTAGGDSETQAKQLMQWWKEVGLDVKLSTGRPIEFNKFYELVEANSDEMDLFLGAWGTGGDPNPNKLWGVTDTNFTRYTSDTMKKTLAVFETNDMFDAKKEVEAYKAWQKASNEEAFSLPISYRVAVTAINKRVKAVNLKTYGDNLHLLELTAENPTAHK